MTEIPTQLKIGANTVSVTLVKPADIDNEHNGGSASWEQNKIQLANDMPQDRTGTALLHEILHLVNIYLTEEETTYLSESLYQVLHDNKLEF